MNDFKISSIYSAEFEKKIQRLLDQKTKPPGSLGALEKLALQISLIRESEEPKLKEPQLVVFAGDHGLTSHGVSAYPKDVTWQMVENFLSGGAAVSVIACQHGIRLTIVDCGVDHDFQPRPNLLIYKIAYGTADPLKSPAMTMEECHQAIGNGSKIVRSLPGNSLLLGEMGIGNTSSASLLMARLTGESIDVCTGAGTGLDDEGVQKKISVLRRILERVPQVKEPLEVLATFGGFEIATMVGAVLQAAQERRVIVVDGFITTSAVLVAELMYPSVVERCVFSHQSQEKAHGKLLEFLKTKALLDLQLRLGEGSGAALVWPLLESACRILNEMASFQSAGVSEKAKN